MSPARRTWFSCVILLGILLDLTFGSIFRPRFPWEMLGAGVSLAAVVLAGTLWVHGVRGAGRGWRRADLFRQVTTVVAQPLISLRQELAFVEAYLGIEQARLGERLKVVVEVPEDLETLPIPPLSLQVLVENAIKHGVAPLEPGGTVRIGAERREGALYLWVEDPGTGASPNKGTGTALETLRQRLENPGDLEMGMVGGWHRVGFRWRLA